jgi:hypothetical protein
MDQERIQRAWAKRNARVAAQLQEARQRLIADEHLQGVRQWLKGAQGEALMALLERLYVFGDLVGASDGETYFRLGQRDVVMTLRSLRDDSERTGEK